MTNTPLNPDALEVATRSYAESSERAEWCELGTFLKEDYRGQAREIITAYLAVAQQVVNSVEELDALPLLTIVRDAHGHRAEKWAHGFKLIGAVGTYSIDLPARVLYRPEVPGA